MNETENYLAHHGIKGQKWGIRRTPEELGHKTKSTSNTKKTSDIINEKLQQLRSRGKAKSESDTAEDREKLKQYLRKHPEKLPKYSEKITEEEAHEIAKQINFDRSLKDIKAEEHRRNMQKLATVINDVRTIRAGVAEVKNLYNDGAEMYNAFIDAGVIKGAKYINKLGGSDENKARAEKKAKEEFDKALRSGDPEAIKKAMSTATSSQLNDAVTYLNNRERLDDLIGEGAKKRAEKKAFDKDFEEAMKSNDIDRIYEATKGASNAQVTDAFKRVSTLDKFKDLTS